MFLDKRWVSHILHHLLTKSQEQKFRFKGSQKRDSLGTWLKKIPKTTKDQKEDLTEDLSAMPFLCEDRPLRAD